MPRLLLVLGGAAFLSSIVAVATPAAREEASPDALLDAYTRGDYQVLARTVTTSETFEKLYKELKTSTLGRWSHARQRLQYAFLLDLAFVGFDHAWRSRFDLLDEARKFLVSRPEPPGQRPLDDACEIAWHKTSVALLESLGQPNTLERYGVQPLTSRMAPVAAADGQPYLIDPWVLLARAMMHEAWALTMPELLRERGEMAVQLFDEAARHDALRAEALVRKSWLLVQLDRPADALRSLDALGGRGDDLFIQYWSFLFRGRAFEDLRRPDEAARAYEDALTIVPHAQSPAVALTALHFRRNQDDDAFRWAAAARTGEDAGVDPWWKYKYGEYRFFESRLAELRRSAR